MADGRIFQPGRRRPVHQHDRWPDGAEHPQHDWPSASRSAIGKPSPTGSPAIAALRKRPWRRCDPHAPACSPPPPPALRFKDALFTKSLPDAPASIVVGKSPVSIPASTPSGKNSFAESRQAARRARPPDPLLAFRRPAAPRPAVDLHRLPQRPAPRLLRPETAGPSRRNSPDATGRLSNPGAGRRSLFRRSLSGAAALRRGRHLHPRTPRLSDCRRCSSFDRFAPYRRKLPNWPFYYRAADPALCAELVQPKVWDPSSFDGDASFE